MFPTLWLRFSIRACALLVCTLTLFGQPLAPSLMDALNWRLAGPFRGGRVVAVAGVPGSPTTFYFGSVGGGVWKTTDGGIVWNPVFDNPPGGRIASIGAIAVAPSDPRIVYVGTGEADVRSSFSFGNGVYRSEDGGKTWIDLGLKDTRQIGRIIVDPLSPDRVFVAALGHPYGPNAERGVYRSSNGGKTWEHVLDRGPDVGAVDLAMAPDDPRVMFASMWNVKRPTWSQYQPIEGDGSGLFRSVDGGKTWSPLTGNGLPAGKWGRVGVDVAPGMGGRRVYALIDCKDPGSKSGLYRSNDGGGSWTLASADPRLTSRAWYFSGVTVDPTNGDIVYFPNVGLYKTTDAGKTISIVRGAPGGDDYHSLWVDPRQPGRMILGTDQGATISPDGGVTWSSWYNQPTAQLYHVITDNAFPYSLYGSQQDSGTAVVPSRTDRGVIAERDFRSVGGAESGYIAPDPLDPDLVYINDTGGQVARFDRRTGEEQVITPWPLSSFGAPIEKRKYRNTWTSPLVFSEAEPKALYFGTQYVLRTTDGGLNWVKVSPDLTAVGSAEAKDHGVVYTIAPSPKIAGQIWAGTDTGLIHLTRDGGKTWVNVTPPGLSEWSKVTQIEASRMDPAVAYAAVDRHRLDDFKPYIYRTADYGKTWKLIVNGLTAPAFINSVRADPVRKGLLYAATELGVAVSFDDGENWQSLNRNLPPVSVRDLVVHGDDLAIATFGRSFWIMDNVTPLRQIASRQASALLKPATAIRINNAGFTGTPLPVEIPKAENPPMGATIDYVLSEPAGSASVEIVDAGGAVVRRYSSSEATTASLKREDTIAEVWQPKPRPLTTREGLNRFLWDLRLEGPEGPLVPPGVYQVKLSVAGKTYSQPLEVKMDPRSKATAADIKAQFELGSQVWKAIRAAEAAGKKADDLKTVLGVVNSSDRRPPQQAYEAFREAMAK